MTTASASLPLFLYNSESKQKELFVPIKPQSIGLYVCGMTVYDYCHIGHARVMVAFDVMVRFLRSQGWSVTYVRNITDIDDKIIARANENKEPMSTLTDRFISAMHEDADRLGCLRPDISPKATEYINEIQQMITTLVTKNNAYPAHNGDVYYAVDSFTPYGRLSKRKQEDMQAGARVEIDKVKKNPMDFVLWKAAKTDEPAWSSPWGNGRPGWHIECSAMSTGCLGNHFDIHGGGGDLLFPHHENEIAQSEAATGEKYVNTWMHVGFVNVDGEKMSKSLGNFFTIRDVLQQFLPEVIRYFIVASHYRSPLNFSDKALKDAHLALAKFYNTLKLLDTSVTPQTDSITEQLIHQTQAAFNTAMSDDFNTPEALAILFELSRQTNLRIMAGQMAEANTVAQHLCRLANILGLLTSSPNDFLQGSADAQNQGLTEAEILKLIDDRTQAKANKDFLAADTIRKTLLDNGVILEDSKTGTTWRRG